MNSLTPKQQEIVQAAQARLEKYPWYRGICLDKLPTDRDILQFGEVWAADQLVDDTWYWDHDKDD